MPQQRMMATRAQETHNEKSMNTPLSKKGEAKMSKVMHEFKKGKLHSGKGGKIVKSRKQAVAIGLNSGY